METATTTRTPGFALPGPADLAVRIFIALDAPALVAQVSVL